MIKFQKLVNRLCTQSIETILMKFRWDQKIGLNDGERRSGKKHKKYILIKPYKRIDNLLLFWRRLNIFTSKRCLYSVGRSDKDSNKNAFICSRLIEKKLILVQYRLRIEWSFFKNIPLWESKKSSLSQ